MGDLSPRAGLCETICGGLGRWPPFGDRSIESRHRGNSEPSIVEDRSGYRARPPLRDPPCAVPAVGAEKDRLGETRPSFTTFRRRTVPLAHRWPVAMAMNGRQPGLLLLDLPSPLNIAPGRAPTQARQSLRSADVDAWYRGGTIEGMAMNLRLSDEETEALRRKAAEDGVSMQEVARVAIAEYVSARPGRLAAAISRVRTEDAELLERLGR